MVIMLPAECSCQVSMFIQTMPEILSLTIRFQAMLAFDGLRFITDHVSGPGRAIGTVRVCVRTITFELDES